MLYKRIQKLRYNLLLQHSIDIIFIINHFLGNDIRGYDNYSTSIFIGITIKI